MTITPFTERAIAAIRKSFCSLLLLSCFFREYEKEAIALYIT
ncbi:MAG TPA: hypothetical protein V6D48_22315 [Oculatellaceae cyanobacterium]